MHTPARCYHEIRYVFIASSKCVSCIIGFCFTLNALFATLFRTKHSVPPAVHPLLTHVGEIVDQDYVANQVGRRAVEHRVHGAQQHRPRLVVEADDHIGWRQVVAVPVGLLAPVCVCVVVQFCMSI